MPDWVVNELTVTGERMGVEAFQKRATAPEGEDGRREFAFQRLVPMPGSLTVHERADWRKANWGADSEAVEAGMDWDGDALVGTFETAWRPPLLLLQRVSQEAPRLTFELNYRGENSDWRETTVFVGGRQIS